MITASIREEDFFESWSDEDAEIRARYCFPVTSLNGSDSTMVACMDVPPGNRQGRHSNSAEETHLILQGTAEIGTDQEKATATAGDVVVIPARVPHDVKNVGDETLRVVFFMPSSTLVTVFDETLAPAGQKVFVSGQPDTSEASS
ncbi:MAG: cupin domain-containing protein [Actinomycetota bacterium]|nr:cupin domain-containing protein [Actinomycetota bacterium]